MSKTLVISLILTLYCATCFAQNQEGGTSKNILYLKEFKIFLFPKKYPDTIEKQLSDTAKIKICVKDHKGASVFSIFNSKGQLLFTGEYGDAKKISTTMMGTFTQSGDLIKKRPVHYYKPQKKGNWKWDSGQK